MFEQATINKSIVLSLLVALPGTMFIGVDLHQSGAISLKSCQYPIVNMQGLSDLIQTELKQETPVQKGDRENYVMGNRR